MTLEIDFIERETWLESLVPDQVTVKRDLRQAGFAPRETIRIMKDYENIVTGARREIDYAKEHSDDPIFRRYRDLHRNDRYHQRYGKVDGEVASIWANTIRSRFANVFQRYREEIVTIERTRIKVPLFRFHSPIVKNSEVILQETQSEGYETPWLVTVFGSGMGGKTKFGVSFSDSFTSTGGDYKLIFIPVPVHVLTVKQYNKADELVGQGTRVEVLDLKRGKQYHKGIEQISANDFMKDNPGVEKGEEIFPLAGDKSSAIHTHQKTWQFEKDYEPKIGLKALDTEISVAVKVLKSGSFSLTFKLPAGRDYHLRKLRNGYGFYWEVKED